MGQTHRLRTHPGVGCLWGDLLYAHWLPWPARVGRRRVVGQRVAACHPSTLYGNAPYGGGLVRYVLAVRGRSLASIVLAGLSLLTGRGGVKLAPLRRRSRGGGRPLSWAPSAHAVAGEGIVCRDG